MVHEVEQDVGRARLFVNCESRKTNLSVQEFGEHIDLMKDNILASRPKRTPCSCISSSSVCKLEICHTVVRILTGLFFRLSRLTESQDGRTGHALAPSPRLAHRHFAFGADFDIVNAPTNFRQSRPPSSQYCQYTSADILNCSRIGTLILLPAATRSTPHTTTQHVSRVCLVFAS